RLTIGATGIYQHNYSTSSGQIYTASWNTGSTLEITGYTSNVGSPTGLNQSFSNVIWNCSNQADDFYLDGSLVTINGDFEIREPISGFIVGLTENADYTLNIGGDLIIASDV